MVWERVKTHGEKHLLHDKLIVSHFMIYAFEAVENIVEKGILQCVKDFRARLINLLMEIDENIELPVYTRTAFSFCLS